MKRDPITITLGIILWVCVLCFFISYLLKAGVYYALR
jgi:hypothetical protein